MVCQEAESQSVSLLSSNASILDLFANIILLTTIRYAMVTSMMHALMADAPIQIGQLTSVPRFIIIIIIF